MGLNSTTLIRDLPMHTLKELGYSNRRNAIVCDYSYSSSTMWLNAMTRNLSRKKTHLTYGEVPILQAKSEAVHQMAELQARLVTYFKFLVTRHPFERLVYIYNFFDFQTFIRNRGEQDYVETFKSYFAMVIAPGDIMITFRNFVRFVVNSPSHFYPWRSLYESCSPCEMNYDFIAYYEWDVPKKDTLLQKLNITDVYFVERLQKYEVVPEWLAYYNDVDDNDKFKLYQLYRYDFVLFGYTWPFTNS